MWATGFGELGVVRCSSARRLRADGGLPPLAHATEAWPGNAVAATDGSTEQAEGGTRDPGRAASRAARPAGRLPVPRRRGRVHLRRQGQVGAQARRLALRQGAGAQQPRPRRDGRRRRARRMRRRRLRGRGAARRAELHQAVPAALQHPPARRQVLPVHRDLARRGLPARLLHARAPPRRPRVLRPLLERQARALRRSRCSRRCSCSAPAPARSRGGAAAARAWTTTSSAAGRPASATSPARSTARASTA